MITLILNRLKRISFLFLLILIILSCSKIEPRFFYYDYYTDNNKKPGLYLIKKINYGKYRQETDYIVRKDGSVKSKSGNKFDIFKNMLLKIDETKNSSIIKKPFLSIKTKDCVNFKYENESLNDFAATEFCFLGQENILIRDKEYKGTYKFKKEMGMTEDKVRSIVYLDKNFVLLKEEFISGYGTYFRIERIDTTLKFQIP